MKNFNFLKTYKNKILKGFVLYFLRLHRSDYSKSSLYHIVVVNSNNRIVTYLGYINLQESYLKSSYKSLVPQSVSGKFIVLDLVAAADWLAKGAIPTPFLSMVFSEFGLLKSVNLKNTYELEKDFIKSLKLDEDVLLVSDNDSQNSLFPNNIDKKKIDKKKDFQSILSFHFLNFKKTKFNLLTLSDFETALAVIKPKKFRRQYKIL
jgi:ribosomal protein S16